MFITVFIFGSFSLPKTKVITLEDKKRGKQIMDQSKLKANTCKWRWSAGKHATANWR